MKEHATAADAYVARLSEIIAERDAEIARLEELAEVRAEILDEQEAEIARLREALKDIWTVAADMEDIKCGDKAARGWIEVHARAALTESAMQTLADEGQKYDAAPSAEDVRRKALEEAAQIADDHARTWGLAHGTPATVIAAAIRALAAQDDGA